MTEEMNAVEAECAMFWRASRELRAAERRGEDLFEFVDELDVLHDYAEHPPVKQSCQKLLAQYQPIADAQRRLHVVRT